MTKSASPKPEPDSSSEIDPEIIAKIAQLRVQMRESFGKVVMAMMALPRQIVRNILTTALTKCGRMRRRSMSFYNSVLISEMQSLVECSQ